MEARSENEVSSRERQLNGGLKSLNPFLHPAQTTVNELSSTATNPFFTQGKDCNGNDVSRDNNKDFILIHGQSNGWSHFPTSSPPSLENDWAVFPSHTLSQETNQITFPSQKSAQDSYFSTIFTTGLSKQKSNICDPFKEETNVSQSMVANEKRSEKRDYLLEHLLSNQKNDEESIPSSTASNQMDVFEDCFSFLPAPVINNDIFTTTASQSSDIFQTPKSSVQNGVFQKIQLFQNSASVQNGHSRLSDNSAVHNGQDIHFDKMFQPTELSHGIFQKTDTLPSPLNASTNEGLMFKKQPPKPAPRRKAPKNPDQSVNRDTFSTPAVSVPADQEPAQTLFTPTLATSFSIPTVPRATTNTQDTMPADELHSSQVYEDILFIGQEKCVEDWPEDSPELRPDWKPPGKLKLRRESLRISEAALNSDSLGKKYGKIKKKLSISKRGSKEQYLDSSNGAYGYTLPWRTKYHASEDVFSPEEEEQNAGMKSKTVKSKKPKFIVPQLQYRGSKKKSLGEVFENGSQFLQASKSKQTQESYEDRLRNAENKEPVMKDCRPKEPFTTKFKPSLYHRRSKDAIEDDLKKMNSLSFLEESKKKSFKISVPHLSQKGSKSALENDIPQKGADLFKTSDLKGLEIDLSEDQMRKSPVQRVSPIIWKNPKSALENDIPQKGADLFKASDIKGLEINVSEDYSQMRKSPEQRVSPIIWKNTKGSNDAEKGVDLFKARDIADDDWTEKQTMDVKTEKLKKAGLPSSKLKARDQLCFPRDIEPPGATSGDYYLSEAAKAEWMSSQMDVRRALAPDEDEELEAVKEEVDGDTDSLMEWWNTVELWDELPSDEEISLKEDETKSFTEIADKVHHGLRVFYKVFTEHAEVLYQHVLCLYTIGDDLSNFHRRTKIANITGGTTTAVGGVAAITGLALAPVTMGASLIISAVGLGVATAGGIAAASATISDNVHDMTDRKKIEVAVQDYETRLAELRRCLRFVAEGVRRMRFHPLLRRNNYYAGDWEVRRALQTISLVGDPVEHAEDIVEKSTVALNSVCKGMDNYFCKDSKELKKGCKKEVTMQVNMLAKLLHEGLAELTSIREQLMEAMGHV